MGLKQDSSTQLRDHYLQTLGIVQYVPRELADEIEVDTALDSYADNHEVSTPAHDSAEQPTSVATSADQSNQPLATKALLSEDVNHKATAEPAVKVPISKQESTPLSLDFVFWQPTDELLIATTGNSQLPDGQQVNLLARIVATIDHSARLPQFDVISWPPHPSMQGGENEAREFISTLIKSRLAAKSTKLLLVLGESAAEWLFSQQQCQSIEQGLLVLDSQVTAIITPSLEQMLCQPQSKRDTWQIICRYFNKNSLQS
ncbi:MAG: hypothetical protein ACPH45_06050 [Porticoccaceae bacterium]